MEEKVDEGELRIAILSPKREQMAIEELLTPTNILSIPPFTLGNKIIWVMGGGEMVESSKGWKVFSKLAVLKSQILMEPSLLPVNT